MLSSIEFSRVERQGNPKIYLHPRKPESARHNTDDGIGLLVKDYFVAQGGWVRTEVPLPESTAYDNDLVVTSLALLREKITPYNRSNP
jgi:hypothetical protein